MVQNGCQSSRRQRFSDHPTPHHYGGDFLSVSFRADERSIAQFLPPGLKPAPGGCLDIFYFRPAHSETRLSQNKMVRMRDKAAILNRLARKFQVDMPGSVVGKYSRMCEGGHSLALVPRKRCFMFVLFVPKKLIRIDCLGKGF